MKENTIRLAGISYESLVNGPGIRRVLFSQGCVHNCEGCFNKETHSFNGGNLMDMDEIIKDIIDSPFIKGVTFSGGDPWEQADKFAYIGEKLKEKDINIWSYTGYTFDYIIENKDKRAGWNDLLNVVDVLIDGKFELRNKKSDLRYKGSSNQRIIDVKESIISKKLKTLDTSPA